MKATQLFETTIADQEEGYCLRFLVMPRHSLAALDLPEGPSSDTEDTEKLSDYSESADDCVRAAKKHVISTLKLEEIHQVPAALLPQVISAMLRAERSKELSGVGSFMQISSLLGRGEAPTPIEVFADYAAFANVIPLQKSPLSLVSLAGKAAEVASKPAALGALIGVAAGGFTPLLLLTVPAGIILCGTATAFAKIVDERRHQLLDYVLGVPRGPGGSKYELEDGAESSYDRKDGRRTKE